MGLFSDDKPYTAVTARINQLLSAKSVNEFEPELELAPLLEVIKIQGSVGSTEAARAIRKKLKHGTPSVQYRALVLLELLVSNGGKALQPLYHDPQLIDRLKIMLTDPSTSPKPKKKLAAMTIGWSQEFGTKHEYLDLVSLSQYVKKTRTVKRQVPRFLDDQASELSADEMSVISSHQPHEPRDPNDPDRQYEIPQVDVRQIAPEIRKVLAQADENATKLKNSLASLNRQRGELAIDNVACQLEFEKCRQVRRKVLRYLQLVTDGDFLGLLINANDKLIEALQKYSDYSTPYEESVMSSTVASSRVSSSSDSLVEDDLVSESEDENNPFADSHKVD